MGNNMRLSHNMIRIGNNKHITNPSLRRTVPSNQTKQALKVLKAHNKFGKHTLSSNELDDIPGLEILRRQ